MYVVDGLQNDSINSFLLCTCCSSRVRWGLIPFCPHVERQWHAQLPEASKSETLKQLKLSYRKSCSFCLDLSEHLLLWCFFSEPAVMLLEALAWWRGHTSSLWLKNPAKLMVNSQHHPPALWVTPLGHASQENPQMVMAQLTSDHKCMRNAV